VIPYCQHEIRDGDRKAVSEVLASSRLTQGPAVEAFERALGRHTGSEHAVAVSSGTSALQIALMAMGIGPGDEVIVPSLTFLATANAVLLCNATPIFADIDPETLSLDPADVARKVSDRTRGAILVHYAGHVGDVEGCRAALAEDHFLIEDACHALGAMDHGQRVGGRADAACFSFHPAKHITTGEGGAITTQSAEFAAKCRRFREHGVERDASAYQGLGLPDALRAEERGGWVYEMHSLSANHRLPDLGAALGLSQLDRLDEIVERRGAIAHRYEDALANDPRIELLSERPETESAWHLYPIRVRSESVVGGRAAIYRALHEARVGVQVHYIPIHLQPYYRARFGTAFGDLPATEAAYLELLSLPLFPSLSESAQDYVLDALDRALTENAP